METSEQNTLLWVSLGQEMSSLPSVWAQSPQPSPTLEVLEHLSLLLWPHADSNSSWAGPRGEIWPLETSLVLGLNQQLLYTENVCKAKALREGEAWLEWRGLPTWNVWNLRFECCCLEMESRSHGDIIGSELVSLQRQKRSEDNKGLLSHVKMN